MGNRAVFLDRDGTIAEDVNYCRRVEDFHILPTVPEAIRLLNQHGFKVVVITNQSGIARGYFTEETLAQIHNRMNCELLEHGAMVDAIYYCPHHPDDGCNCRKPGIELFVRAAKDLDIDLSSSYMIGDSQMDIEAGRVLGCKTILVTTGPSGGNGIANLADYAADRLIKSAEWIVRDVQNVILNADTTKSLNLNILNNLKISVIICAHTMERLEDTLEAINSVLAQTLTPDEVIVSVDHNEELFHRLKSEVPDQIVAVLNEGTHGLSETRNVGIRNAGGDIIVFMDDDAVAQGDWLENLVSVFANPNVMVVGGNSIPVWPREKQPFWFPEEFDWSIGCTAHNKLMLQKNGEVRNVTGSNMAFRIEAFKQIGFWDTELGAIDGKSRGGEEANICLRIKGGIDRSLIMYEPKAVVFHKIIPGRDTPRHLFRYCWDEGFNRAKMRKLTADYVENPLSTEISFLCRLLTLSVFGRLVRFYRVSNLPQIGAIMASLMCMGITYLIGRFKYK